MAKASEKVVALKKDDQLPAELAEQFALDAGQGVSTSIEDNLVPFVAVLQSNSPQVSKRDPKYIEGAEPGDIMLTSMKRIWKGEVGLDFQPCAFDRDFVEWKLRDNGGGFVGRHPQMPSTAKQTSDPKDPNKSLWLMPSGTQIVDTRYHFGFILNPQDALGDGMMGVMQAVVSLSSTGHTFSRTWMTQMSQLRVNGKLMPARSRHYRLKTVPQSNAKGNWFAWEYQDLGWITDPEQYAMGTNLYQAIRDGSLKAAAPEHNESTEDEIPF